ncbi:hypothetical protein F7R91_31605 [Streptomyces luteolifulvus]|uniref:DUF8175 domain-containing protein n=1 Tax=Streptomyces luteolifulvus TaxID=2615112 RepID=A0A6H9UTV8_9ACTN|nr:hypothetical protein [Streptomyces luteolifulvus]KAB1141753.1 hypothetical protein F7R91_31605 [Streptomyces luteolifulvus]
MDGPFYKEQGWINAALFLGFIVVMSLMAFVNDTMGSDSAKGTDSAADSRETLAGLGGPLSPGDPQQVRQGPGGRPENCRTDDRDTARPTAAPTEVRWQKLVAIMVPTSPSAGPLRTEATMWWCFAHTPTGAVLAAHIIPVELSGAAWRMVAEQQVVPGEPRDAFVTIKARADETNPEESAIGRFVGFSLASYSGDSATVRLLVTNPTGGYLSTSVSVRWREGDWKVALRHDGSLYSSVKRTADPDGFVMWGG